MTAIVLAGRTDIDEFFRLSGSLGFEKLNHTPFIVFSQAEEVIRVQLVMSANELLALPDDTPVMAQWRGEWRSDFFQFNVGQVRRFIEEKDRPLKGAKNVVKTVGPQGGFRHLSYEYVDDAGVLIRSSTGSKIEAQRLEALFAQWNITVTQRTER